MCDIFSGVIDGNVCIGIGPFQKLNASIFSLLSIMFPSDQQLSALMMFFTLQHISVLPVIAQQLVMML